MVTRFTLGAGLRGLLRQSMVESLLLAAIAGAAGIGIGKLGLFALSRLGMDQIPRASEIALDPVAIAISLLLAAMIAMVLALVPTLAVMRSNPSMVLREEGRSGTASRGARRLRQGLVAAQVAFAFILLAAAGLLFASFGELLGIDPGYDPDDVLMASLVLPDQAYGEPEDIAAFAQRGLERVRAIPGVESASLAYGAPMTNSFDNSVLLAEGWQPKPGEGVFAPTLVSASDDFIESLDIEVLAGRSLRATDTAEAPRVALIDQRLARRFWGDRDPLGKRLFSPQSTEDIFNPGPEPEWITVVGLVADIKIRQLVDEDLDNVGVAYFPFAQQPRSNASFIVETSLTPMSLSGALQREVAEIDPQLPLFHIETLRDKVDISLLDRRTPMLLAVGFGAIALMLASIGIYGVLAYLVARRSREMGIRMALGSTGGGVFALILREGLAILALGLAFGLAGAFLLRNALAGQLYGVGALDPRVLLTAVLVLSAGALFACSLPALRAARVHPSEALRD